MSTEAALQSLQQLVTDGEFARACEEAESLLQEEPDNTEVLYIKAVSERYADRPEHALKTLDRLKQLEPENGRAWQEQGHVLRSIADFNGAIRAYSFAVQYNPALTASLEQLVQLLESAGNRSQAASIKDSLDYVNSLPRPLVGVLDLMSQGKILKAEALCRRFLQKIPHHPEAMRLLADIGLRLGAADDAEFLLESAIQLAPDNNRIRIDYIQALRKRQKFQAAREQAQTLLNAHPENLQYRSIHAIECMQSGDFATAIQEFKTILKTLPDDCVTLTSLGHAHKTGGNQQAAVECYKKAISAVPQHGEAYYSLANLKVYRFDDGEIKTMQTQVQDPDLPFMSRVYLHFALGKAYEDQKEYDQAFEAYAIGNALKKAQSHYDADVISRDLQAQKTACTPALFNRYNNAGNPSPDPIFIVGLPRAGSTLLEQILSSHSQVDGTLELPDILSISQRLRRMGRDGTHHEYPEILHELSPDFLRELGDQYLADTRIHRGDAPFFIDKMPNNFRHIGLIRLILPNAIIIDARRNPMDCCFSGYKQLFAEGQEFSYSLEDIGRYYQDYLDLMDHWEKVLPGSVLCVRNEDVIDDLEGQVHRMLNFLGLPFEESCLQFYETERNIRTPSSEQVRQPIKRSGIGRWRPFAEYLQPLENALGSALEKY